MPSRLSTSEGIIGRSTRAFTGNLESCISSPHHRVAAEVPTPTDGSRGTASGAQNAPTVLANQVFRHRLAGMEDLRAARSMLEGPPSINACLRRCMDSSTTVRGSHGPPSTLVYEYWVAWRGPPVCRPSPRREACAEFSGQQPRRRTGPESGEAPGGNLPLPINNPGTRRGSARFRRRHAAAPLPVLALKGRRPSMAGRSPAEQRPPSRSLHALASRPRTGGVRPFWTTLSQSSPHCRPMPDFFGHLRRHLCSPPR
ncbi:hypothetical protein ABIA32_006341 [Streptacidiphilus sp. MAP12-20]